MPSEGLHLTDIYSHNTFGSFGQIDWSIKNVKNDFGNFLGLSKDFK